jgi:hypothetical protein
LSAINGSVPAPAQRFAVLRRGLQKRQVRPAGNAIDRDTDQAFDQRRPSADMPGEPMACEQILPGVVVLFVRHAQKGAHR